MLKKKKKREREGNFSSHRVCAFGFSCDTVHEKHLLDTFFLLFLSSFFLFFLLLALRHRLFVTAFANPDIRDRGFFMGKYPGVAVEAVQACIFEMFFVIIKNGLRMIYAFRTAGYDEYTEDGEGYGIKGDMLFHGSSKGLRSFLSLEYCLERSGNGSLD